MFGPATRGPGARCERDPRHARRRAGAALSLLPLVIALGLSPWPAPAAPAAAPPSIDERLARERTHRLDDILQSIGELPEADRALRRAGRGSAERTQRITRLLALSGRGLGSVPESTAVAAGCLDLLTGDADLRESNLGARLASASDAAFQLLLADPPPLRSRTRELWQTWRAQNVSPDAWSLTTTRVLGSVVTPLPAAGPPAPTPRLLEGEPGGMPPLERGFDLPLEATVTWLPDGSGVLARGPDQVYRLRFDRDTAPVALGAQWPGAPLALAPAGDYAAGVSPAAGRDSLQALKLYRLADRVDAVVLDRGRRFVDLAWVANGTRLAALVDGSLRLYELAIARPKSRPLDLAPGAETRARLRATADGRQLVVAEPAAHADGPGAAELLRYFDAEDLRPREAPRPPRASGAPTARVPQDAALSPRGTSVAFLEAPAPESGRGDLGPLLGASRFLAVTATARVRAAAPGDSARLGAAPSSEDFAWHPDGRWLAVAHPLGAGRTLLLLHDLDTGDALPLGDAGGVAPAFSPGGRYLLWRQVDRFGRGSNRLIVRTLAPTPPDPAVARQRDAIAFDAYNTERPSDALRHWRDAVRLAPDQAAYRLGVARAYRALAEPMPVGGLAGWYLEGAARAAATATELNPRSTEARVEFMEDQLLRAALLGRREGDRLQQAVEAELQSYDGPALFSPAGARAQALMDLCVAALLWQPDSETLRVLYEGLAARAGRREASSR